MTRLPIGTEVVFIASTVARTRPVLSATRQSLTSGITESELAYARGHIVEVRGELRLVEFDGDDSPRLVPAANLEPLRPPGSNGFGTPEALFAAGWAAARIGEPRPDGEICQAGWDAAAPARDCAAAFARYWASPTGDLHQK